MYRMVGLSLLAFLLAAQTVRAPRAQTFVDEVLRNHSEIQTIDLYATPPGMHDNLIIASNHVGRVGQLSSGFEAEATASGKPSVTSLGDGAAKVAAPLNDRAGRSIGTVSVSFFPTRVNSVEAMRLALAIRDELKASIPDAASLFLNARLVDSPLVMIAQTPLPQVKGGFGHFAFDPAGNRLFVAAPENHTIEIFNLAGEHKGSFADVKSPKVMAYVSARNLLLIADSGQGACLVVDGKDLHVTARIPLGPSVDAGIYDASTRRFYVAGGGEVHVISTETLREIGRIRLKAAHVGSMAIDLETRRLFVSLSGEGRIAVISLENEKEVAVWNVPGLLRGTPLALDSAERRLLVAGAAPGMLEVVDSMSGKVLSVMDCIEGSEDITYDPASHRAFVTGTEGVGVFMQTDADHYRLMSKFGTLQGKTSFYVPSLKRLYIIHGWSDEDGAALQVYQVRD